MMEEFIKSFINEAKDLVSSLEGDLLKLENDLQNTELIDNIFRVMHTLKGAAGMYGFQNIEEFTHEFENTYDLIRDKKQEVTPTLIDITLKAADIIKKMLKREDVGESAGNLLNDLKAISHENSMNMNSETVSNNRNSTEKLNYGIVFMPGEDVFERGIDPEATIEEIKDIGSSIVIMHENNLSWAKQKKKKICQTRWEIYLKTHSDITDIENIFMFFTGDEFSITIFDHTNNISEKSDFVKNLSGQYAGFNAIKDQVEKSIKSLDKMGHIEQADTSEKDPIQEESVDENLIKSRGMNKKDNDSSINVSSKKIDELLNLVSELVTSNAGLQSQAEELKDHKLLESVEKIGKLTKQFRNNALDLRLIPISTLLGKFKRHVRDLSKELGKEVELIIDDHDTEIDKSILKAIENPLLHIIRNSIDHGIENTEERKKAGKSPKGLLKIISFYSGANVIIQVHDDGRGINLERVKECAIQKGYLEPEQAVSDQELLSIIMEPGFTTSENVSMVSGRGVGMDVVKRELSEVKGSLEIETEKGLGTFITLKLPTTLSIIDTLMVEVNALNYLIPLLEVEYCFNERSETILNGENNCLQYKDNLIPFIALRDKFKFPSTPDKELMVVVISKYDKKYALVVDQVVDEQQTVIKNLGMLFSRQPYFSGGNIMADGKIALILDTNYLFNQVINN